MDVVSSETEVRNGTTFVWGTVRNERETTQRVEVRSTLDGPTWPPVHDSIRDPRWRGETWTGLVPPGRSRGVGFATSADPAAEPLRIVDTERVEGSESGPGDVEAVLASLDEWAPPRDVIRSDR